MRARAHTHTHTHTHTQATDMEGNEVSDACIDGKMAGQDCVNRFLLKGWELSDDRCKLNPTKPN